MDQHKTLRRDVARPGMQDSSMPQATHDRGGFADRGPRRR